jgi:hypothetical protein
MSRPRRLYKDSKGRYFYIVNNQQKFVKVPKDMAEKDVVKISLKTLENLINKRRVKRRKKRKPYTFEQAPVKGAPTAKPTEPSKLVVEGRKIPQIEDIVKNTKQKKAEQLAENVESFFDTLANKKTGLLSGTELVKTDDKKKQVIKTEKEADKNPPPKEADKSSNKKETKEEEINRLAQDFIEGAMKNAGQMRDYLEIPDDGTLQTGRIKAYKAYLQRVINTMFTNNRDKDLNLSEDQRKEIFQKYSKDTLLREEFNETLDEIKAGVKSKDLPSSIGERRTMEKEDVNISKKPEAPAPTPPSEPKPPGKPAAEQIRNIKKAIRKPRDTSGLMPSLRTPAKTTEEKIAETPSFSSTTPSGTAAPAAPVSTSPMAESIAEQVRREIAIEEKTRSLMGLGEDGNDALYNDEIAKIIKKRVGRVVPVIPSDKVKYLKDYVKRGDKSFAAIVNTNPSESDGTGQDGFQVGHWRAIFVDNRDDYPSIEYFDPLVSTPEKELLVELKKIGKKMNPERMFLYKENRLQRQAKEASTCGYHAAQFVDDRMNGESWCSATGYDDFVNRMGKVDDSQDGEEEIRKTIKKYKVYL